MNIRLIGLLAAGLVLHGCDRAPTRGEERADTNASDTVATEPRPVQQPVERQMARSVAEASGASVSGAIQTQPGPDGSVAQLTQAIVAGDILTVQMQVTGPQASMVMLKLDEVNTVDEATSQRASVLRDASGKWMASHARGEYLVFNLFEKPIIWLKFPAPAPGTQTVSINLPRFGTFVKVPVQR